MHGFGHSCLVIFLWRNLDFGDELFTLQLGLVFQRKSKVLYDHGPDVHSP